MIRARRTPTQTQAWRAAARLHPDPDPNPVPAQPSRLIAHAQHALVVCKDLVSLVQDALDVCPALLPVAVVLISCLLAFLGLWLELRAAWAWVETGVYTAPLLGTVFPGVAQEVDASLAQLALTRPWLVPAARTVLVDLWAEAHVGFLGIVLCVGVVSFCAYLSEVADPPPPSAPPTQPDLSTLADVRSLKMFQSIAIDRGDWRMADHYRDEAVRLTAEHEANRLAYNTAIRTRILGEARARDYESTWKGNPHGEELS